VSDFLTVDRIEFIVTYRCNSWCKHCEIERGKRGSHPAAIDQALATHVVHRVTQAYAPRSIMTFGGEPLLFPDVVCAIHQAATASGIGQRQIITNAGYPQSETEARALAGSLADSGVNSIYISVDCFHQEHIPLSIVEQNVRSFLEAGIARLRWNPCWVISREHDNVWNRRTRSVLQALAHLGVAEDDGNIVQPEGNALTGLNEFLPPRVPIPAGSCGDMPYTGRLDEIRSISIEPDGRVAVCDEFFIGNAGRCDIVEILEHYDPYRIPEMRAILEGGVAGLMELARTRGVRPDPDGYYTVCHMCKAVRRELAKMGVSAA